MTAHLRETARRGRLRHEIVQHRGSADRAVFRHMQRKCFHCTPIDAAFIGLDLTARDTRNVRNDIVFEQARLHDGGLTIAEHELELGRLRQHVRDGVELVLEKDAATQVLFRLAFIGNGVHRPNREAVAVDVGHERLVGGS